jgi:prepilin-type N-terminal cleavage/methylation domain-containing protein
MKKSAFTLIELAVVLIIIGIIIVGITKGANLINIARLNSARSITSKSPVPEISGLLAWYESSSVKSFEIVESVNGAQTSKWYDISPASIMGKKNMLSRTASSAVTYQFAGINNTPSIKFDGTAGISISELYQGNPAQLTVFLVFRPTVVSGTTVLFDSSNSVLSTTTSIGISSSALALNFGSSTTVSTTFSTGQNYVVAAYIDSVTTTNNGAYINNATTLIGAASTTGSNRLNGITLGTNRSGGSGFNGLVSEVIVYNRPLKLQERIDVMRYLSRKYRVVVIGAS